MRLYKNRPSTPDGFEWCPGCEEIKENKKFSRSSQRSNGLQSKCKSCATEYRKNRASHYKKYHQAYYQENKSRWPDSKAQAEYSKKYYKHYRTTPKGRAAIIKARLRYQGLFKQAGDVDPMVLRKLQAIKSCMYCHIELTQKQNARSQFTIEHLVPLSRGGTNASDNLGASCRSCNGRKRTRTHTEFFFLLQEVKNGQI